MATPPVDDYQRLVVQVALLHERSKFLKDVFGTKETAEMLNDCAPAAFLVIYYAFVDLVILGIARLATDTDVRTLSLSRLIDQHGGTPLETLLKQKLSRIKKSAKPLKKHRDKRIAHHDRDVATGSTILPALTVSQIEDALRGIREFMNEISRAIDGSEVGYENTFAIGDGKSLVSVIKNGMYLQELNKLAWEESDMEVIVNKLRYCFVRKD